MAEKKVSLRSSHKFSAGPLTPGKVPEPNVVDMPGFKGTLPFQPGTINPDADMPTEVFREEERIRAEPIVTPETQKRKAIKPPPVVDIDDLPEEKQQEVLQTVKTMLSRPPKEDTFIPRGPGIAEARAHAMHAAAKTTAKINAAQAAPAPQPKPAAPPPPPPPVEEDEQDVPESSVPDTPPVAEPQVCCHCGWPTASKEWCNPTKHDKQFFVAAVLGQKRFVKEYNLLGGQMRVGFRALTVEENDLIIKQLVQDWNDGKISGPAHSVAEATKYQLALALDSVETNVGPLSLPTLEEYDCDEPPTGTILPQVVDYINKHAMPTETIRRIVSKAYGHFIETQSKLEAMAESSDFWKTTGE
jgi:hypothetical protein